MARSPIENLVFRQAEVSDATAIAEAHRDSVRSIGPAFYDHNDVEAWQHGVAADLYLNAMAGGEVFFVAIGELDGIAQVLGFSSEYPVGGTTHGVSVYVRGAAARQGIGTELLRRAETHAAAAGACAIQIEASLAGVDFYKANGYREIRRGHSRLTSGYLIGSVLMRKELPAGDAAVSRTSGN